MVSSGPRQFCPDQSLQLGDRRIVIPCQYPRNARCVGPGKHLRQRHHLVLQVRHLPAPERMERTRPEAHADDPPAPRSRIGALAAKRALDPRFLRRQKHIDIGPVHHFA
jgi:hypothetical protein